MRQISGETSSSHSQYNLFQESFYWIFLWIENGIVNLLIVLVTLVPQSNDTVFFSHDLRNSEHIWNTEWQAWRECHGRRTISVRSDNQLIRFMSTLTPSKNAGPYTDATGIGTGLCGPSKFFRDLCLPERFSGGTRLNKTPKFACCREKTPTSSVSHVLLLFSGWILGACIFKVHIYYLGGGGLVQVVGVVFSVSSRTHSHSLQREREIKLRTCVCLCVGDVCRNSHVQR